MKTIPNKILPNQSLFSVYRADEDYFIINPSINFWFKLSKEQLFGFRLIDGKSNYRELLKRVVKEIPSHLQETCKIFLRNLVSNFPWEPTEISKPKQLSLLYLVLTNNCNSSCVYCFRNAKKNNPGAIDKNLIKQTILTFKKISSENAVIVYTGGEPTCFPDLLEIAKYAMNNNFKNTLQTNGLLLAKNVALYASVFDTIQISLDSTKEKTNDWLRGKRGHCKTVINTIELLKKYNVRVRIAATITKKNLDGIARIRETFPDIEFQYTPMLKIGRGKMKSDLSFSPTEFLKHLSNIPNSIDECAMHIPEFGTKNMWCGAGSTILSVSPEGDVFPCQMLHHENLKCGNIKDQALDEIYNSSIIIKKFRDYSVDNIKDCRMCDIRYICGGGCIANGYWVRNKLFDKDSFCAFNKNIILHNLNNQFKEEKL